MSVLLVPSSLAVGVDDAEDIEPALAVTDATEIVCVSVQDPIEHDGSLAISGLGSFPLQANYANSCGGHGCDDSITGDFFSNGAWGRDVEIYEEGPWGASCKVWCHYQGASHSLPPGEYHGRIVLTIENNRPVVAFGCGTGEDPGGWEFGGRVYLDSKCGCP